MNSQKRLDPRKGCEFYQVSVSNMPLKKGGNPRKGCEFHQRQTPEICLAAVFQSPQGVWISFYGTVDSRKWIRVSIPARGVNFISNPFSVCFNMLKVSIPARGANFIRHQFRFVWCCFSFQSPLGVRISSKTNLYIQQYGPVSIPARGANFIKSCILYIFIIIRFQSPQGVWISF